MTEIETPTTDETAAPAETTPEEVAAAAEAPGALEAQFRTAKGHLDRWFNETREVTARHWTQALERARTHLEVEGTEAAPAAEPVEAAEAAATPEEGTLAGASVLLRASLQGLVQPRLLKAQEKGASLLLGTIRRVRGQIEALEANLEAARPAAPLATA